MKLTRIKSWNSSTRLHLDIILSYLHAPALRTKSLQYHLRKDPQPCLDRRVRRKSLLTGYRTSISDRYYTELRRSFEVLAAYNEINEQFGRLLRTLRYEL
jgi:hypothetical protein